MGAYEKTKHGVRRWLLRRLPTCKETVKVISHSMERPLSLRERVLMKLHLTVCMWCQWYFEHLHIMRNTLEATKDRETAIAPTVSLSDEARERIKRRLSQGG